MPPKTTVPSDCWLAAPAPVAVESGTTPRMNAMDSHQNRPEAPPSRFHRRIDGGHAFRLQFARELYDQDLILGRQRDHKHETDLSIECALSVSGVIFLILELDRRTRG